MDNKEQDRIRNELLQIIYSLIEDDERLEVLTAAMAESYLNAIIHFQSLLDLHNRSLLSNLKYQVRLMRKKYHIER